MLSTRDVRIARKVKRRLSEITNVKQLVVYGSRARGRATKYSDLDLYIELNANVDSALRRKIREIAWEVSLDSGIVISTLVASDRLKGQPILKSIQAEGIPV
jgi:predicted nucleotidyltransferase